MGRRNAGRPESTDGLGHISLALYLSPAQPGKIIWGVGPACPIRGIFRPAAPYQTLPRSYTRGPAALTKKLFSADPARIGRFDAPPMSDAVPASPGRHATFRAAGTSLNGQSQSDGIPIDVRCHWYGGKVEDGGRRVRARPGMILGRINSLLEAHGRRLGPDPASSHACTIGGVIANNSGGMRCTVQKDAYHNVSALTFVTPSGAVIDTSRPEAEGEFALTEPQLAEGLLELSTVKRRSRFFDASSSARRAHSLSSLERY